MNGDLECMNDLNIDVQMQIEASGWLRRYLVGIILVNLT